VCVCVCVCVWCVETERSDASTQFSLECLSASQQSGYWKICRIRLAPSLQPLVGISAWRLFRCELPLFCSPCCFLVSCFFWLFFLDFSSCFSFAFSFAFLLLFFCFSFAFLLLFFCFSFAFFGLHLTSLVLLLLLLLLFLLLILLQVESVGFVQTTSTSQDLPPAGRFCAPILFSPTLFAY